MAVSRLKILIVTNSVEYNVVTADWHQVLQRVKN